MTVIEKQKKNGRSFTKSSLYYLLGPGNFHKKLISFAHNLSEEVQVVFYEKDMKKYEWVKEQSCQLIFSQEDQSILLIPKETRMNYFMKLLDCNGIKMIYLTKRRENRLI